MTDKYVVFTLRHSEASYQLNMVKMWPSKLIITASLHLPLAPCWQVSLQLVILELFAEQLPFYIAHKHSICICDALKISVNAIITTLFSALTLKQSHFEDRLYWYIPPVQPTDWPLLFTEASVRWGRRCQPVREPEPELG